MIYFFSLVDEGIENPNITGNGHHQPASETHLNGVSQVGRLWPNIECWLGSFVIFQGIWTSIAKKPYIFVLFQGGRGGPDPLFPPLDLPMHFHKRSIF